MLNVYFFLNNYISTLKFDGITYHQAKAIYHAIRVEKEPSNVVKKICEIDGQFVIV